MKSLAIREPFRGRSVDETFANIINKVPPPPSEASPDIGIPPEADAIVMRSMEKKPGDRFQSMREMLAAMREVD